MKKVSCLLWIAILVVALAGCKGKEQKGEDVTITAAPSPSPTVTLEVEEETEDEQEEDPSEDEAKTTGKLEDYYPLLSDTEYVYQGEGSEYASFHSYVDFVDEKNNKLQTRSNNGGTETVRVIEIKDGSISVIYKISECYYRDNLMDEAVDPADVEILLMEPLVKGTQWTLPDGRKRYISGTDISVDTPTGSYTTIEVTTEDAESIAKDYYAPGIGPVKTVFGSGDMEVTSTLSEINKNQPYTQLLEIYYPDTDEKIYVESVTLSFHTGDITREIVQEALQKEGKKESYLALTGAKTKINSMYLGKDGIAYIDFSSDFVSDMNAGADYEQLILQSITNTVGNYYGVQKVYITVEGKPYESGHILMKKGETFEVNMDAVMR